MTKKETLTESEIMMSLLYCILNLVVGRKILLHIMSD
jgi:hypothetical protein